MSKGLHLYVCQKHLHDTVQAAFEDNGHEPGPECRVVRVVAPDLLPPDLRDMPQTIENLTSELNAYRAHAAEVKRNMEEGFRKAGLL